MNGLISVVAEILAMHHAGPLVSGLQMAFGGLTVLIGLGLIARVEFIRGIVTFFCGLSIILNLLCAPFSLLSALASGPFGIFVVANWALNIAVNGFMIYLIGETDRATFKN